MKGLERRGWWLVVFFFSVENGKRKDKDGRVSESPRCRQVLADWLRWHVYQSKRVRDVTVS